MSNLMVHTERFTRSRDPETSHEAGESINAVNWTAVQRRVYEIVSEWGPIAQFQVVDVYRRRAADELRTEPYPYVADVRIRTAMSALEKGGSHDFKTETRFPVAIRFTGQFTKTPSNCKARLYEVVR